VALKKKHVKRHEKPDHRARLRRALDRKGSVNRKSRRAAAHPNVQKDLGDYIMRLVQRMNWFDPDQTWKKVSVGP
jgi:hypothetical protein